MSTTPLPPSSNAHRSWNVQYFFDGHAAFSVPSSCPLTFWAFDFCSGWKIHLKLRIIRKYDAALRIICKWSNKAARLDVFSILIWLLKLILVYWVQRAKSGSYATSEKLNFVKFCRACKSIALVLNYVNLSQSTMLHSSNQIIPMKKQVRSS